MRRTPGSATRTRVRAPGTVRPARRPAGWRAPGPRPAAPAMAPGADEDLCYLAGDWRIFQRIDGHRWSLDDLVTAWFAARQMAVAPRTFLDLGCGIGAVLMLLAWRFPDARGLGIEAQALSVDLARRSLAWNGAADRCRIVLGDLRDPATVPADARFDLVTGTPPYLLPDAATPSLRVQRGACHIAYRGGIDEYCLAAARAMAPGARFVACEAAANGLRVECAAARAALTIERRQDVVPRAGKAALFSVYVMRREPVRCMVADAPLVVRDVVGRRTPEFKRLREEMGLPP
jgi:tRNA1Val (adenine37-N6)-methyltransferase